MQPVTAYRPGRYPPSARFAQFGDDLLGHALTTSEEAQAKLASKRQGMQPFHVERLQNDGFMPVTQSFASHVDPEVQAVEAFDAPVRRPAFLPTQLTREEFHDPESESEATVSVPASPRDNGVLDPFARVARAGFEVAGHLGHHAKEAFKTNVAETVQLAKKGAKVVAQVASAAGSASMRAASAGASHAQESMASAMEPGSNTRRAAHAAASHTAEAAHTAMEGGRRLLHAVGPPVAHGAYAAAAAAGHGAKMAADVAVNHVAPAVHAAAKHGLTAAARALERATLSASEIIQALNELQPTEPHSSFMALENGSHPALSYGPARSRMMTPPRRRNVKAAAAAPRPYEHSFRSAREWLEFSHNRGVLVEELYKRPRWQEFIKVGSAKDELRKKLLQMSPGDLAEILVKLDSL